VTTGRVQTVQYLWSNQMQLFASIFFFFSFLMPQVKLLLSGALWFHPSMWDDRCAPLLNEGSG
jgi:uncharacterized paraquat-inducible protein A